jgi:dihydroxyacetone kinase
LHFYLNWAKERIDEMDAALASLEVKANQAKADSKVKGDQLIADLKKRRAEFQTSLKAQAEAAEAAWARAIGSGAAVERIRSPSQNLLRERRQAD